MNQDENLKQCIHYFKNTPGFRRVFEKIRDKYRSLGTLGGTIQMDRLTFAEKEALSGLLRKDYYSRKSAGIKVEKLVEALADTRFQGLDFVQVLRGYFDEDILSKKEELDLYREEKNKFFMDLIHRFQTTRGVDWLTSLLTLGGNAGKMISRRYDENRTALLQDLELVCRALNQLSFDKTKTVRLAIFASLLTKNPHRFDLDTECGKLLLHGISWFLQVPLPQNAEEKAELLYTAGVITDEISNFTVCSGFTAFQGEKEHPGWCGFANQGESMQISLFNLSCVDNIIPKQPRIFVFENPTVFTEVLRRTADLRASLVCTNGQLKLASLILLDRIAPHAVQIFYSGDFDPEGLAIADRLKQRYGGKLVLWRYLPKEYVNILSDETLDAVRLKKLEKIQCKELQELASQMSKLKLAAFQELLLEEYIRDIQRLADHER